MKKINTRNVQLIVGMLTLFVGRNAFAKVYIEITGLPGYSQDNTTLSYLGGATDGSKINNGGGISYDLRTVVGYRFLHDKLLIGANYNRSYKPYKLAATTSYSSRDISTKMTEWGASIGYFPGHFRMIGSYLFSGTADYQDVEYDSAGTLTLNQIDHNKGGSGYQFLVGYDISINSHIKIGPTLVYRSITYTSQSRSESVNVNNSPDTPFTTKATFSSFTPMVSIMFEIGSAKSQGDDRGR